jgi:hypothetical protein
LFSAQQVTARPDDNEQQQSAESETSTSGANETETQQFKQWLENFYKQCNYSVHELILYQYDCFHVNFRCEIVSTTIINGKTLSKQRGELLLCP